jgi:peptidoglycan-associated lipoprotein
MSYRRLAVPVLAASLVFGACSSEPPPDPQPTGPTAEELARQDSIRMAEEARQDSIRMAEEARQDSIRRMEEATRAARETLETMVFFDYDESEITPAAERVLRQKVEVLEASPAVELRIEGHADERGSTEYNIALGNRRAESVRQFFVDFGLDPDRFSIVSYGEERPLVNRSDEQAWERNRRAEFVITAGADQIAPVMGDH